MTKLTIKTNNQPRRLMSLHELSSADQVEARKRFDWMDSEELETSCDFFKYRDNIYHLSEFMSFTSFASGEFKGWNGYSADTYFSGILVRIVNENEDVVVGTYFS